MTWDCSLRDWGTLWDGGDTFAGCFASKDGEIVPLDGDIYDNDEEVISYEEWSRPEDDIQNGLTIVVKGEWISGVQSQKGEHINGNGVGLWSIWRDERRY